MWQKAIIGCSGVRTGRAAVAECVRSSSFAAHTHDRLSAGGAESVVEMLVLRLSRSSLLQTDM